MDVESINIDYNNYNFNIQSKAQIKSNAFKGEEAESEVTFNQYFINANYYGTMELVYPFYHPDEKENEQAQCPMSRTIIDIVDK